MLGGTTGWFHWIDLIDRIGLIEGSHWIEGFHWIASHVHDSASTGLVVSILHCN